MPAIRALRGATTVDDDLPEQIIERVADLLETMFDRNDVDHDDLISIFFTATPDATAGLPSLPTRPPTVPAPGPPRS